MTGRGEEPTYDVAPDVAWVSREELDGGKDPAAYVAPLPDGPALVLQGPACVVWLALARGGTMTQVCASVAEVAEASTGDVRDDVEQLVAHLVSLGVVRRR